MPITITQNGPVMETSSLRSEAVQDFISIKPGFIVRYGTLMFIVLLALVVTGCWFIQYPEVVTAKVKLNSLNAPKAVIVKTSGKLMKLFVHEGKSVSSGSVIGYVESIANPGEAISLSSALDSISSSINLNKTDSTIHIISSFNYKNLGELQQPYQTFMQAFITFKDYNGNGFYIKKKALLAGDLNDLQRLHSNLIDQKNVQKEDEQLARKTFEMNEKLLKEKVISEKEFRDEKSRLLNKNLVVPQSNSSIIQNESQQNDKQKEMLELDNAIQQQRIVFMQALNTLKSATDDWKKKYLLIAPVTGTISFAGFFDEKQELNTNQVICYVNPANSTCYAEAFIPQSNFGKVHTGQKVRLSFAAYPSAEFGYVTGQLAFVSPNAGDSGYIAKIILPSGLITDYNKQIQFHNGLFAQAEIITESRRLLTRLYFSIYGSLHKD